MKSNKGISLISLTIYLIVLTILVGITAGFTRYFFRNSNEAETSVEVSKQYTRALEYLIEDVNSGIVDYIDVKNDGEERKNLYFYLSDNTVHQYYWEKSTKKMYYLVYSKFDMNYPERQLNICEEISNCNFEIDENDKSIFTVSTTIGDNTYDNIFKTE